MNSLRILRRRVAGVHRLPVSEGFRVLGMSELGSRASQGILDPRCVGVRTAEHAPRSRFRVLERRHGLAEIAKGGAFVIAERRCVRRDAHRRGARGPASGGASDRVRGGVLLRRARVAAGRRVRFSDGLPAGGALGRGRAGRLRAAGRPTRPTHLAAAARRFRGPRGPRGLARARVDDDAGRADAALNYHLDPPPSPSVSEARFGFNRSYSTISLLASVLQAAKAIAYPSI